MAQTKTFHEFASMEDDIPLPGNVLWLADILRNGEWVLSVVTTAANCKQSKHSTHSKLYQMCMFFVRGAAMQKAS